MANIKYSQVPPHVPIQDLQTPVQTTVFYSEIMQRDSDAYNKVAPIQRGTVYSTILGADQKVIAQYPLLYFLKESAITGTNNLVIWTWANDPLAESSYNAQVDYLSESTAHPVYTRVYTMRRNTYDTTIAVAPTARGSTLTSIIGVNITNQGDDYTEATGTCGTATISFVCYQGKLIAGIITDEGSGITSGQTITITGDGGNGAATAYVQPLTATLHVEKKQEFPENHPLRNEYVQIIREYRNPTGPILEGQDYVAQYNVPIAYTLQDTPAGDGIGDNLKDITPGDTVIQKTKSYDITALTAFLNAYHNQFDDKADLNSKLPNVLQSVTCVMNRSTQEGGGDSAGSASASGPHGGYSLSAPNSHQSSVALVPTLIIKIATPFKPNATVQRHQFFMPLPVSQAQITAKLLTYGITALPWPDFNPRTEALVTKGLKVVLQVRTNVDVTFSYYDGGSSDGSSATRTWSKDLAMNTDQVNIPATIHPAIGISGDPVSDTEDVTAQAFSEITGTIGGTADTGVITATASASVTPSTIPGTAGVTDIPTTGKYILSQDPKLFGYGFVFYDIQIWDAAVA